MAAGYACMAEGEPHAARWLFTSLDPPATITACDDDLALLLIPVLAANLEIDQTRLYDAIKRHVDRETAKAAKAVKLAGGELAGPGPDDTCEECGRLFGEESPDCPRLIWDRHPRPAAGKAAQ